MPTHTMPEKTHHGRAVKRIREMLHIKQEVLADALGISQQSVSLLENKEAIEPETLEQIAKTMKVPVEAIRSFNEEQAINVISSTFNDNSSVISNYPTFNPIDKIVALHEEKIALYERMLKEKDEMMERLEKVLGKK